MEDKIFFFIAAATSSPIFFNSEPLYNKSLKHSHEVFPMKRNNMKLYVLILLR